MSFGEQGHRNDDMTDDADREPGRTIVGMDETEALSAGRTSIDLPQIALKKVSVTALRAFPPGGAAYRGPKPDRTNSFTCGHS